jgi:hypothetical protein
MDGGLGTFRQPAAKHLVSCVVRAPDPSSPTDDVLDANLIAFVTAAVRVHHLRGTREEPFHDPHGPRFPLLRRLLTKVLYDVCSKTPMTRDRSLAHLGDSVVFGLADLSLSNWIEISLLDRSICHEGE